ncbi:unnamed protein product [Onchocerca flexuosa]|uniref:C2H2-type domain-containing protein n=1 Tax=Onchocerca flexuosa TaxID=387005 RepID=A0A183HNW8_9BILA|nr:unnamed protein product [Onchocerca flexuosa]
MNARNVEKFFAMFINLDDTGTACILKDIRKETGLKNMLAKFRNVLKEARFDCETCSRKFRSRASFAIHLRRYHLVSIRDVPYGFTEGTGVSSNNISGETCAIAQNIAGKTEVVTT